MLQTWQQGDYSNNSCVSDGVGGKSYKITSNDQQGLKWTRKQGIYFVTDLNKILTITLRCVIPVVCVTNGREENEVKQGN